MTIKIFKKVLNWKEIIWLYCDGLGIRLSINN